jgi:hypothetical protein
MEGPRAHSIANITRSEASTSCCITLDISGGQSASLGAHGPTHSVGVPWNTNVVVIACGGYTMQGK